VIPAKRLSVSMILLLLLSSIIQPAVSHPTLQAGVGSAQQVSSAQMPCHDTHDVQSDPWHCPNCTDGAIGSTCLCCDITVPAGLVVPHRLALLPGAMQTLGPICGPMTVNSPPDTLFRPPISPA
jgi:hypothetical protein